MAGVFRHNSNSSFDDICSNNLFLRGKFKFNNLSFFWYVLERVLDLLSFLHYFQARAVGHARITFLQWLI